LRGRRWVALRGRRCLTLRSPWLATRCIVTVGVDPRDDIVLIDERDGIRRWPRAVQAPPDERAVLSCRDRFEHFRERRILGAPTDRTTVLYRRDGLQGFSQPQGVIGARFFVFDERWGRDGCSRRDGRGFSCRRSFGARSGWRFVRASRHSLACATCSRLR
jgi:hypothetical protein